MFFKPKTLDFQGFKVNNDCIITFNIINIINIINIHFWNKNGIKSSYNPEKIDVNILITEVLCQRDGIGRFAE